MINIVSPINQLGYGITGLNIVKALSKKTEVSLWPIGQPSVTSQEDADIISSSIANAKMPNFDAPCIKIWHQHDMTQFVGRGTKIGFPIFELDAFNDHENHHLYYPDKLFVCSEWAKEVVVSNLYNRYKTMGVRENVHVIPLGVDESIFSLDTNVSESENTIFFNCGKWEVRKGHDILIEAFCNAFKESDNVELWMMCENPFYSESEENEWKNLYLNSKLGDKIKLIERVPNQQEVYNIMSKTDCGVFPSRGEGWNLEALEMMACGKRLIITDYSAHTEFCTKENSFLVTIKDKEMAYDGKWFHGKVGQWAKIGDEEVAEISKYMRKVHFLKHKYKVKLTNNQDGVKTAKKYNWDHTAELILRHV